MSDISPAALKLTAEQEAKVSTMERGDDIAEFLKEISVQNGLLKRDWDPALLIPVAPGTVPKSYGRTVTIDGRKHIVEAATEIDLERAVSDLYRSAMQPAATTTTRQTEQPPVNQANADQKAALSLEFQMGRITPEEYLQQSGAMDQYLANQGIDIDSLREVTASKQGERIAQSWQEGTAAFLNSSEGADWPGGQENLQIASNLIAENPELMDTENKADALAAVWNYMKEHNLTVVPAENRIASANSMSEILDATGYNERVRSSSIFGR